MLIAPDRLLPGSVCPAPTRIRKALPRSGSAWEKAMLGVVRRGVGLAAVGCAIGLVLGAGAGQLLRSFLVDLSPLDPPTFVPKCLQS